MRNYLAIALALLFALLPTRAPAGVTRDLVPGETVEVNVNGDVSRFTAPLPPDPSPIAAPSDLVATSTTVAMVDLVWVDNATNESNYEIHYSTDAGQTWGKVVSMLPASQTKFTHGPLPQGQTISYRVRATADSEVSPWSSVASVKVKSDTPVDPSDPVPYPQVPAFTAPLGADLSKLPQHAALVTGVYTTSGDISKNCVAADGQFPVLALKTGQTPQLPDVFAGVTVTGGGLSNNDDVSKAGPFAGSLIHSCTFTKSEGFGLLVVRGGESRITNSRFIENKSGGLGGTKTGTVRIDNCQFLRNNNRSAGGYGRTNSNKFTRKAVYFVACSFDGNGGTQAWADNYVTTFSFLNCTFKNGVTDKSGDPWKARDISGELTDNLTVKGCHFTQDFWAAITIDEVGGGSGTTSLGKTIIEDSTFDGKADKGIECRNLQRGSPFHSLRNVTIRNNIFKSNSMTICPSGAGDAPSLSKNNIVIEPSNQWPDGKVTSHVTIKP